MGEKYDGDWSSGKQYIHNYPKSDVLTSTGTQVRINGNWKECRVAASAQGVSLGYGLTVITTIMVRRDLSIMPHHLSVELHFTRQSEVSLFKYG